MANQSDRLLIEAIRKGDRAAWERLVASYQGRLRAFINRRIKNHDDLDDLVQDTFFGFLKSLTHYDDKRPLQTYLFSIASNKINDHLRKHGRHPVVQAIADASGNDPLNQRPDSAPAASSVARGMELRESEEDVVSRCLGEMLREWADKRNFLQVKILELLFVKGWGNKQAAEKLGIDEQQVANVRFAAVRKLTARVEAAGLFKLALPELRVEESP